MSKTFYVKVDAYGGSRRHSWVWWGTLRHIRVPREAEINFRTPNFFLVAGRSVRPGSPRWKSSRQVHTVVWVACPLSNESLRFRGWRYDLYQAFQVAQGVIREINLRCRACPKSHVFGKFAVGSRPGSKLLKAPAMHLAPAEMVNFWDGPPKRSLTSDA
jgi:hypothetical protein